MIRTEKNTKARKAAETKTGKGRYERGVVTCGRYNGGRQIWTWGASHRERGGGEGSHTTATWIDPLSSDQESFHSFTPSKYIYHLLLSRKHARDKPHFAYVAS